MQGQVCRSKVGNQVGVKGRGRGRGRGGGGVGVWVQVGVEVEVQYMVGEEVEFRRG